MVAEPFPRLDTRQQRPYTCGMSADHRRGKIGIALLGISGVVSFLADLGGARTTLAELWPVISEPLPLLALVAAAVGVGLVGESLWRWYVPRRPRERFRQLAPQIKERIISNDPSTDAIISEVMRAKQRKKRFERIEDDDTLTEEEAIQMVTAKLSTDHELVGLKWMEDRLRTSLALKLLRVGMPESREDLVLLLLLAEQGLLRHARLLFPYPRKKRFGLGFGRDTDPLTSDENETSGQAALR